MKSDVASDGDSVHASPDAFAWKQSTALRLRSETTYSPPDPSVTELACDQSSAETSVRFAEQK